MSLTQCAVVAAVVAVLMVYVPRLLQPSLPEVVDGYAAPGWEGVGDTFKNLVKSGELQGGVFTVYHNGDLLVQYWGGYADIDTKQPWTAETLNQWFSTTKAVCSICVALLVDRGLMSYSEPVAKYWPEFAQNGKADVTVDMLISHQAGLAVLDEPFSAFDILKESDKLGDLLAEQTPHWEPGTARGYHALTFGLYMDQLIRRVDPLHRSLPQFFEEEVAKPLDLDFYIGLPKEENYRCAHMYEVKNFLLETAHAPRFLPLVWDIVMRPSTLSARAFFNPSFNDMPFNNPYVREIGSGSTHGFGTAASVAKLMSVLAGGGQYGGEQFMSPATVAALNEPLTESTDVITHLTVTGGRGTFLAKAPHGGWIFGHSGSGGQVGWADPHTSLGWSYTTNYHTMHGDGNSPVALSLQAAMYDAWKKQQAS